MNRLTNEEYRTFSDAKLILWILEGELMKVTNPFTPRAVRLKVLCNTYKHKVIDEAFAVVVAAGRAREAAKVEQIPNSTLHNPKE